MRVNHLFKIILSVAAIMIVALPVSAQLTPYRVDNSFSSEWEATAFNNGRRLVRDSDGYLHTVWHSRNTTGTAPNGSGCSIFYSYTTTPCKGDGIPDNDDWVAPINIVDVVENPFDNRYPALVIEHGSKTDPKGNDVLHVVWQRDASGAVPGSGDYEIWYMNTYGQDIDIAGGLPAIWGPPIQIWNLPGHHDLVPSIACNYNNHLHVAWQCENWDGDSEILYARSTDHGMTWTDNMGSNLTTFGGPAIPYNISNNICSSQCPSIACVIDAPTTPSLAPQREFYEPLEGTVESYTYTTCTVHVAWHDKDAGMGGCSPLPGDYHIWYGYSPDDGTNWPVLEDVTILTAGDYDTYVSLTVDYYDQPHIAFMHNCDNEHDPDPPGPATYIAGLSPVNPVSFPGPDPKMYGVLPQIIIYSFRAWAPPLPNGIWQGREMITMGMTDDEFPSVAMDEQMGVHIAWQSWGAVTMEYIIMVNHNPFNWMAPGFINWMGWGMNMELTSEGFMGPYFDDLFPSEAHKKLGMYSGGASTDLDLVWTRIGGQGSAAAIGGNNEIWYLGATTWKNPPAFPGAPTNPQVESKTNPTDVSTPNPDMTWTFVDTDVGDSQTAYRVLIASSSALLSMDIGDLLDTGPVVSTQQKHNLTPALSGGSTYYWKVKNWDSTGLQSDWCPEQTFAYAPGVPVELSIFRVE